MCQYLDNTVGRDVSERKAIYGSFFSHEICVGAHLTHAINIPLSRLLMAHVRPMMTDARI